MESLMIIAFVAIIITFLYALFGTNWAIKLKKKGMHQQAKLVESSGKIILPSIVIIGLAYLIYSFSGSINF